MELDLNQTEERILADLLDLSLNRLQDEISHTDDRDYRDMLKNRKEILAGLRGRLH